MSLREKIQERVAEIEKHHGELDHPNTDLLWCYSGWRHALKWVLLELKKEEEIKHWTYCLDCKAKLAVMASN